MPPKLSISSRFGLNLGLLARSYPKTFLSASNKRRRNCGSSKLKIVVSMNHIQGVLLYMDFSMWYWTSICLGFCAQTQYDYVKHIRKKVGPTCEYRRAITGNHDIGWQHDLDPAKGGRSRSKNWHGRNRTDVTTCEGLCLSNAYGIIS